MSSIPPSDGGLSCGHYQQTSDTLPVLISMPRYKLRTLLIVLAIGPVLLGYYMAMVMAARDSAREARTHKPVPPTTRLLSP